MTLTPEILKALREAESKCTPGPWQTRFIWRALDAARKTHDIIPNTKPEQDWPDAEFIALSRNHMKELLDEVGRLKIANNELRAGYRRTDIKMWIDWGRKKTIDHQNMEAWGKENLALAEKRGVENQRLRELLSRARSVNGSVLRRVVNREIDESGLLK